MNKEITPLKIGMVVVGVLGSGYLIKYLWDSQKSKEGERSDRLTLESVRDVNESIKVTFLMTCLQLDVSKNTELLQMNNVPRATLVAQIKAANVNIIENMENSVLKGTNISKDMYALAL